MRRIVLLFVVVLLCLTSACSYTPKSASPVVALYQHSTKIGAEESIVYLLLGQGTFQISDSIAGVLWEGSYKTGGDQLVFELEDSGPVAQAACTSKKGFSYRWTFDSHAKELTLEKVEDGCEFRAQLLLEHVWALVQVEEGMETEGGAEPEAGPEAEAVPHE